MNKISKSISKYEKVQIYTRTLGKVIRGFFYKNVLRRSNGLLFVGKRVSIQNGQHIICGKNVKFESDCEIQGLSKRGIIIGNDVTIGKSTMIRPSSYYGVGNIGMGLKIGDNSSIGPFGYVGCAGSIKIGKNVMIGPRVSLFAENHNFLNPNISIKQQGVSNTGIIVDDDCWIGSGAIILDGVHLKSGSVVAAGAVVTKSFSKNVVIGGVPAKVIKSRK